MSAPFLIQHPDGREYELHEVDKFVREYEPQGFKIVGAQPPGHELPARDVVKEERTEFRDEKREAREAEAKAKAAEKTDY